MHTATTMYRFTDMFCKRISKRAEGRGGGEGGEVRERRERGGRGDLPLDIQSTLGDMSAWTIQLVHTF